MWSWHSKVPSWYCFVTSLLHKVISWLFVVNERTRSVFVLLGLKKTSFWISRKNCTASRFRGCGYWSPPPGYCEWPWQYQQCGGWVKDQNRGQTQQRSEVTPADYYFWTFYKNWPILIFSQGSWVPSGKQPHTPGYQNSLGNVNSTSQRPEEMPNSAKFRGNFGRFLFLNILQELT